MASGLGFGPGPAPSPQFLALKKGGGSGIHSIQFLIRFLAQIRVFTPETAHSEARFGILVKNQPRGWILSQIGAKWTGFVAFFSTWTGAPL